jgi:hypothetical protein
MIKEANAQDAKQLHQHQIESKKACLSRHHHVAVLVESY